MNIFRLTRRFATSFSGLLDTTAASLGTLLVGIVAVRVLGVAELAIYSITFVATMLLVLIPQQVCLAPRRMKVNIDGLARTSLRADLRASRGAILLAAAVLPMTVLPGLNLVPFHIYVAYCVSGVLLVITSTLNQHTRSILHVLGKHAWAASASGLSLLGTAALLLISMWIETPSASLLLNPITCLAIGQIAGLFVWLRIRKISGKILGDFSGERLGRRIMYLAPQISVQGVTYGLTIFVAALLGAEAVASLEVARIATAPIFVLITGFTSAIVPKAVISYSKEGIIKFRKSHRNIQYSILCIGIAYILILAVFAPAIGIVLDKQLPLGLTIARAGAFTIAGASNTLSWVAMAIQDASGALKTSLTGALLSLVSVVPVAILLGAFAVPIAESLGSAVRATGCQKMLKKRKL